MTVAFGTSVSATPATGTSLTSPSITTPTTNPVVFAHVGLASTTATVSSLTITGFGGTATEVKNIRTASGSANCFVSIWKIVAPTANTAGTVRANVSASVAIQLVVSTFSGADQSDPSPLADAQSANTGIFSQTLTPTNLVTGDASSGAEGNTESQNLNAVTPTGDYLSNSTAINLGVGHATNTTGVTFGTDAAAVSSRVAVRVKQASAAAAPSIGWLMPSATPQELPWRYDLNQAWLARPPTDAAASLPAFTASSIPQVRNRIFIY